MHPLDPPCFDPAHEDAAYYEWLEEQAEQDKEVEMTDYHSKGLLDKSLAKKVPNRFLNTEEELPF